MDAVTFAAEHGLNELSAAVILSTMGPQHGASYCVDARDLDADGQRDLAVMYMKRHLGETV